MPPLSITFIVSKSWLIPRKTGALLTPRRLHESRTGSTYAASASSTVEAADNLIIIYEFQIALTACVAVVLRYRL